MSYFHVVRRISLSQRLRAKYTSFKQRMVHLSNKKNSEFCLVGTVILFLQLSNNQVMYALLSMS